MSSSRCCSRGSASIAARHCERSASLLTNCRPTRDNRDQPREARLVGHHGGQSGGRIGAGRGGRDKSGNWLQPSLQLH